MVLLVATPDGAIVVDPSAEAFRGFDRSGAAVWTDDQALRAGAQVSCLERCPDAVFSGGFDSAAQDLPPYQMVAGRREPFPVSTAHHRRVLAARSPSDAVVAEGEADGRSWIRVLRPPAGELRVPVPGAAAVWSENPSRTVAVTLSRQPGAPDAALLWAQRDAQGWSLVDSHLPAGGAWGACVAGEGEAVLLVGPQPTLVLDRQRSVPVRTDLGDAGECTLGRSGGTVLQRSMGPGTDRRTAVRGIDLEGRQTWSRDYPEEVFAATDPSGDFVALTHDETLELLDREGRTVATRRNVESAAFTAGEELVTVSPDGQVRWEALPDLKERGLLPR
jgi:hypothetical protein